MNIISKSKSLPILPPQSKHNPQQTSLQEPPTPSGLPPKLFSTTYLTSISTKETDDISFAQNQLSTITYKKKLRQYYGLQPWKRSVPSPNIVPTHRIVSTIRKSSKNILPKQINWANQQYFTSSQINKFMDCAQILKRIQTSSSQPLMKVESFTSNINQITKNSILMSIMKEEQEKLKVKETQIQKALSQSMIQLDKDIEMFNKYKDDKMQSKEVFMKKFNEINSKNKKLGDISKMFTQEHKIILDDMENVIRNILTIKFYVEFVNELLGRGSITKELFKEWKSKLDLKGNREHALEKYASTIINTFSFYFDTSSIDNNKRESLSKLFDISHNAEDNEKFLNAFKRSEDNILYYIKHKDEYDQMRTSIHLSLDKTISPLYRNYSFTNEQLNILNKELQDVLNEIDMINKRKNACKDQMKFMSELLIDLYEEIEHKEGGKILLPEVAYNKLNKAIKSKEHEVNKWMDMLDELENDSLFRMCVEEKRERNKKLSYLREKEINANKIQNKVKEITMKMEKVVIKGRGRYTTPVPPNIIKQRHKSMKIKLEQQKPNEYEGLNY